MINGLIENSTVARLRMLFAQYGFEIYLVGGSVRDTLSGHQPDDLDFTTNAMPNDIERILKDFTMWDAGKDFGTIAAMVNGRKVEITTYRADRYRPGDRHPVVKFGDRIEEDLLRRDFTINAMAMDLWTGEVIDPYEGQIDLERRFLACPQDCFTSMSDDPLRVLRAVRFASVRGFELADDLKAAMDATSLDTISQERKTAELEKIMAAGPQAVADAWLLCSPRLRKDLFGPFDYDVNDEIYTLPSDASPRTIFAFLASYRQRTDEVAPLFSELRLPTQLARHCRDVLGVLIAYWEKTESIPMLVRMYHDEVLDDASLILKARVEVDEHFLKGYRSNLRTPLPVDGNDIMDLGIRGPAIGEALRVVERAFLDNCYLSKQDALALLS